MKTVLFVPGYHEGIHSRDYTTTIQTIEAKGYTVTFVPIEWKRTTITGWVDQLETEYSKHDPAQTILAGFSFGAMTAFVAASRRNPFELWLFSLSPYFSEDLTRKDMKQTWLTNLGKSRVAVFDRLVFRDLARTIKSKTLVFAGEQEIVKFPGLGYRCEQASKLIADCQYTVIPGVGHDVANPKYVNAISKLT